MLLVGENELDFDVLEQLLYQDMTHEHGGRFLARMHHHQKAWMMWRFVSRSGDRTEIYPHAPESPLGMAAVTIVENTEYRQCHEWSEFSMDP